MKYLGLVTGLAMLLVGALGFTGCPAPQPVNANVTVLFTASESTTAKAQVVASSAVSQLLVNVDNVLVTAAGTPAPAQISVLSATQQVDLKQLLGVSALLDQAQIPVGTYTSMQLVLSSAILYLTSAPNTPITNVTMPDGGIFNVPVNVTVVEGQPNNVLVDLGGISLVQLDDGSYELTPDFHVRVPQPTEIIPARAIGEIQAIDLTAKTYTIDHQDATVVVNFSSAVIFLPADGVNPSGTSADLLVGDRVLAFGSLGADGTVKANVVMLFDAEDHHGGGEGENHGGGDEGEGEGEGEHHGGEGEGEDNGGEGESGEGEGETEGESGEGEGETEGESGEGEGEGEGDGESGGHGGHGGGVDG